MNDLQSRPNASVHHAALRAGAAVTLALALGVAGCRKTAAPAQQDDATLTSAVQGKLAADTSLAAEPVQASVRQGVATLDGAVSSNAARSLAGNDAAQVQGIKTVVNNLTIQPITAAAMRNDKANRRVRPSATVRQTRPPSQPQPQPEQTAPIERPAPPVEVARTPASPPVPAFRDITLPSESALSVRLDTTLDSATTQSGDTFSGSIASDVVVDGLVVLPQGTTVNGRVAAVHEAGHFKGSSLLTITLTSIDRKGESLNVSTDEFSKAGNGRGKNSAEKIGGGAAVGAILGGILGGGKGAAIGAGVGGGAGTGVQAATRGQQVQIPAESLVRFHLTSPLTVRVSNAEKSRADANRDTGQDSGRDSELQRHQQ